MRTSRLHGARHFSKSRSMTTRSKLFLVPTGMALGGIVLLGLFFRPPTRGPEETGPSSALH